MRSCGIYGVVAWHAICCSGWSCESTPPRKHDFTSSGACSRKRMRPICSRRPVRDAVTRCCIRAAPPRFPACPSNSIPARGPASALTRREAHVLAWQHERHRGTHAAGRAPERPARRVPRRPPPPCAPPSRPPASTGPAAAHGSDPSAAVGGVSAAVRSADAVTLALVIGLGAWIVAGTLAALIVRGASRGWRDPR